MLPSDRLPNTDRGVREKVRHDALVENTAQAIFYEIQELEGKRLVSEQRWVWELLQNTLDARPQGRQTQVRISWDEADLIFEHNGDAFTTKELAHLVYHGSTKYRDATKRGKFGRGFLVTHLLSKIVKVSGLERDLEGVFQFQVDLDRNGDADAIRQNMDRARGQIENSRQPLPSEQEQSGAYSTRYVYRPDNVGKQAVTSGIEAAKRCFAYVLAFIPELEGVSLTEGGMELNWRKEEVRYDPSDASIRFTRVHLRKIPFRENDALQPQEERFTIIEKVSEPQDGQHNVSLALMLSEHQPPEVVTDDSVPRFFVEGLPVVGTERLPLPMVVQSAEFEVEAGRTGLHLEEARTPQQIKNWELLSQVPNGCIALLTYGSHQNWQGLHLLANIGDCPATEWLDSGRFTTAILQPVVQQILANSEIRLVRTTQGEHVSIKDAIVPLDDHEGKLFDLLSMWKPAKQRLVDRTLAGFWAEVLGKLSKVLSVDTKQLPAAWSIESLASKVSACGNLQTLLETVELEQDQGVVDWLNGFIALVIASSKLSLLVSGTLLPDQNGILRKQSALSHDTGVDEELKDIANGAGVDERASLLHKQVVGLEGKLKDRTELEVLNTLLGKSRQLQPEQNAKLLAWLARRPGYHERISAFPVITLGSLRQLDKNKPLLKPAATWSQDSADFSDLFPKDFVLGDVYAQELTNECWKALEGIGFVRSSLIYMRDEKDVGQLITEAPVEGEEGADHTVSVKVTDIAFLEEKDKGVIDMVRNSQLGARKFLHFIFDYLLRADRSWRDAVSTDCSCGKNHRNFASGWLYTLAAGRRWVPKDKSPKADNIAPLIDASLLATLARDDDSATFLLQLGIGVSDLFRVKMADPSERLQADRLAARMYAQDAQTRALLAHVLDDPDVRDLARRHLEDRELTQRNREVGARVEQLIKQALEAEQILVQRTGIGSDYAVEYDFIEGGQE